MRALVLLVLVAVSCSGKANPNDPRSCPAGLPAVGGLCEVDGLACTYGPGCGASVKCAAGAWAKSDVGCGTVDAGACPTSAPRDGEPCSGGSGTCNYACGDGGTLSASCTASSWKLTASGCALPR
ncbi:MAG: hypothetical protein ABI175_25090 [Polyangiales bacterium]